MLQFTRQVDHRDLKMTDVVWDWVILSALAALFIVRVRYRNKEYWIARRELVEAKEDFAKLRDMDLIRLDASYDEQPIPSTKMPVPGLDRVLIIVVLLAGIWIGIRIWMHHFARAQAVDAYEYAIKGEDASGVCRHGGEAVQLLEKADDNAGLKGWRATKRVAYGK